MDIDVKDPKVVRWVLAVLVILVILPVYFFTSVLPVTYPARRAEIGQLEARHQALSRDLEKARLLVRNLARVEKEYETLHEQWSVAQMLLPQKNEMPSLLRKVTAAGSQSGVEFQLFKPQAPVAREFYAENPIQVKVHGGYHQTGVFLSRLANLNRIVNVSGLALKGLDKQEKQPFTVEAAMTLTAYTLESGGPSTAEPSAENDRLARAPERSNDPSAADEASGQAASTAGRTTLSKIKSVAGKAAQSSAGGASAGVR
jgi:type IV pilus assembly protein PilO